MAYHKSQYKKNTWKCVVGQDNGGVYPGLSSDENPRTWTVTDLDPAKIVSDLAQDLANHFVSINNLADPLKTDQMPRTLVGEGLVRLLDEKQVAGRL